MPKADRLSPGAVKLLQEKQIAHVATVMADGSPQVTPVWVDVDDDGSHVIINSRQETLKTRNGVRNPRIALSVVDFANPYRVVQVRGTIVERLAGDRGRNPAHPQDGEEVPRDGRIREPGRSGAGHDAHQADPCRRAERQLMPSISLERRDVHPLGVQLLADEPDLLVARWRG